MRMILVHGYQANPDMNFHPWLRRELTARGFEVVSPPLPFSGEADPMECLKELERTVGRVDAQTMLLGHSLGGVLALRFLEAAEAAAPPQAVILVGTPWSIKSENARPFFLTEFDFEVVMWKAREFVVVHSKDDRLVPFDHAEKYAKVLEADLIATEGDGHYMGLEYPVLLKTILQKSEPSPDLAPGKSLPDDYQEWR
jgi:predicted alpha/beta hydrolase family esterase